MKKIYGVLGGIWLLGFTFNIFAEDGSLYHDGWMDLNKDGQKNIYEDATQSVSNRVADLLPRMTLKEKTGQLWQLLMDNDVQKTWGDEVRNGRIGSFLSSGPIIENPVIRNKMQHIAIEQSRLGIPLILGHDAIHGFRTTFPIPLAEACAWEPELFERTQTIAAREAAAGGVDWAFAPMVDLARDPRWGRIAEGFGEDPWLGSQYAAACVRGFQGTNAADTNHVIACLKHYVGYGAAEGGREYNTTEISEYTLRNFYLPQFKAGVDAGALTLMSAFNCLSGVPASGNRHTLTDILRGEWKFTGFVDSDWDSVAQLIDHGVAADEDQAVTLAITAGVDMGMVTTNYDGTLEKLVNNGTIPMAVLDEAVRRVLTVKFEKGLFDQPYVDESRWKTAYLQPDAVALAREAAAKGCVLLKNERGTLPLAKSVKKIALIGPLGDAQTEMPGCWASCSHWREAVSLAAGLRGKLASDAELTIVRGCDMTGTGNMQRNLDGTAVISKYIATTGEDGFSKAVAAAQSADVIIMALGEPAIWSGENSSRLDLGLPGEQQELFDTVAALGKPVIVVLFNGRPLALPDIANKAAAILEAWFPGVQAGNGVADILFGDVDPTGRLTATIPRTVGQVPVYYNHYNTGRPTLGRYIDGLREPLYSFGYGLAYTTFSYSPVQVDNPTMKRNGTLTAHVQIKNTGARAGTEVAQLYIRALAASAGPRPVRELKGFQKVLLQPGETRDVSFTLSPDLLGYYDTAGNRLVEPGKYQVWISQSSAMGDPVNFELVQ